MSDTSEMVGRLLGESKITLTEAGALVGTDGDPTHVSTMNRYVQRGARAGSGERVRLEAFRIGARWVTTREAVARFVAALTSKPDAAPAPQPPTRSKRAADRAGEQLAALGC